MDLWLQGLVIEFFRYKVHPSQDLSSIFDYVISFLYDFSIIFSFSFSVIFSF